ncbi:MAG: hypothetical protein IJ629_07530 [Clostridia bacterium]|nr:hypothetical protein [Clostridia bacterium]
MQMISKKRDGVTLIVLIITIIILTIIMGISLNYGLSEVHNVANKKTESELAIVQEAVMQRYALVKSANQLGVKAEAISMNKPAAKSTDIDYETNKEKTRPEGFVGTRIADPQTSIINQGFSTVALRSNYVVNSADLTYEQYYYLLDENDLIELGIKKDDDTKISNDIIIKNHSYIVNYLTGEVFDIANKKYYKTDISSDDPIYTQPTSITMDQREYEFNDD